MDAAAFRRYAHQVADWMADYLEQVDQYPVKSPAKPGDILRQLPDAPPEAGEDMEDIFRDFEDILLPGITHWQSPRFFAYFPANTSYPSLLAEMMTAALGAQCMVWETSPAAAELEEKVMDWLGQLIGIPATWSGVIQSTASDATLCALLTAREQVTGWEINTSGFPAGRRFRIYASSQAHSSIEKGVKIAGFGQENLVYIPTDADFAMVPSALEAAIEADLAQGYVPLLVVACLGTTSSAAVDPLATIGEISTRYGLWLHVDAAYGGAAMILPECQHFIQGIERANSFVCNPHKWLLTHFDCSAYYVRDAAALVRTFSILPEYLRTAVTGQVKDYRDWGVQLGRRFRALKLWMVMRHYGMSGLQAHVRSHITMAQEAAGWVDAHPHFERVAPVWFSLVCFRWTPPGITDPETLDTLNATLLKRLNDSGTIYLTQTRLGGQYVIRLAIGQTFTTPRHVAEAWAQICETAELVQAE
ncbi:MAG: pyridoxal-dependent decarboxylase [Bacteroidia bacterium]|nr:pyridoxal-dependent decarboxylase [Bacteroidia bacterium]